MAGLMSMVASRCGPMSGGCSSSLLMQVLFLVVVYSLISLFNQVCEKILMFSSEAVLASLRFTSPRSLSAPLLSSRSVVTWKLDGQAQVSILLGQMMMIVEVPLCVGSGDMTSV